MPTTHTAEPNEAVISILQDAFDALESTTDSDLDHFEDDEEERECAPMQYAARKIMEAICALKSAA